MSNLQKDIDDLDRMIDTDAAKDAIRSQLRLVLREVAALEADYARLAEQCAAIQAQSAQSELTHSRGVYYGRGDPVPFCPRCYEADAKPIHLSGPIPLWSNTRKRERWDCLTCNTTYVADPGERFLPSPRKA